MARSVSAEPVAEGATRESRPAADRSLALGLVLLGCGLALFLSNLAARAPEGLSLWALLSPAPDDLAALDIHYSLAPRLVVAILSGAALGLSGVLFQQALRNPLAEPGTLGVFAGARVALAVSLLWAPGLLSFGVAPVAFGGAVLALGAVLLLASRRGFSPLFLILSGLVLSLCLDAFGSMLILTHFEALGGLLLWQAGSLAQNNWIDARILALALPAFLALSALLARPLAILELDESGARSLGVSPALIRALAVLVAAAPAALIAAKVGLIGFIGLAGAALARLSGARRIGDRLASGPLIAAGLLLTIDQLALMASGGFEIPAGAVTALLGAPLLLVLIRRMRASLSAPNGSPALAAPSTASPGRWLAVALACFCLAAALSLLLGRLPDGWRLADLGTLETLLPWRLPRALSAAAAGALLGLAGAVLQRMTGNEMASPELLGASSGAVLLLIPVTLLAPSLDRAGQMLVAGLGAFFFLLAVLRVGRRSGFAPERMLVAGVALSALAGSLVSMTTLLGDVRVTQLLAWMSGSTYAVRIEDAVLLAALAVVALALTPLIGRWLAMLPLGEPTARALGLKVGRVRLLLTLFAAVLSGAATLAVGPLSFAGLMAPHVARLTGLRRPLGHALGAALVGATLLLLADWLGRTVATPWQLSAGQVATVLGGLYFAFLAVRR